MNAMYSIAQKREHLKLALALWAKTPPEDVVPHLGAWKCGTMACFGGHLAQWPEFQALGVTANGQGAPVFTGCEYRLSYVVSQSLFGDRQLFLERGAHPAEYGNTYRLTDHEIVTRRLNYALTALEPQA